VRAALVSSGNGFECAEVFAVRNDEPIGLELDDANPACLLTVTWAEPDVVGRGESDFNGYVGASAVGICILLLEPCTKFLEARR